MGRRHFPRADGRTEGPIYGRYHPVDVALGILDTAPEMIPREYRGTGYTLTPEDEYWRDAAEKPPGPG